MAAELIEAGVDVDDTYRRLYERVPIEKLRLIARALEKIERYDEGRLAVTYISADDYEATGAGEVLTEGSSTSCGRSRAPRSPPSSATRPMAGARPARSACARPTARSTCPRSPASTAAAGTDVRPASRSDMSYAELVEFLRAEVSAQIR